MESDKDAQKRGQRGKKADCSGSRANRIRGHRWNTQVFQLWNHHLEKGPDSTSVIT